MKRGHVKTLSAILMGAMLVSFMLSSQAFGWGSATHAYIDDRLGKQGPLRNLNEIYGGMATDVFNYLFANLDWLEYLYLETHYSNNIGVWNEADTILEKAVAFGFVSHQGMIGADATAHGSYDYSAPDGYVIAKTVEMAYSRKVYPSASALPDHPEPDRQFLAGHRSGFDIVRPVGQANGAIRGTFRALAVASTTYTDQEWRDGLAPGSLRGAGPSLISPRNRSPT